MTSPCPRTSHDQRFFLKTQRRREVRVLLAHLPRYLQHLQRHPHSLLARLLGMTGQGPGIGGQEGEGEGNGDVPGCGHGVPESSQAVGTGLEGDLTVHRVCCRPGS